MGQNKYTQLNIGYDGNFMDETGITYNVPNEPQDRRRARIVVAGNDIDKLADVVNTQLAGTEYALPVRIIAPWQNAMLFEFGFTNISRADPETDVVVYNVPAGSKFLMTGLNCSAESVGIFKVYIDNGTGPEQVLQFRNNVTNLNVLVSSSMPLLQANAGDVVTVTASNTTTNTAHSFEGTLIGYTQPL
jgi:hypothetical protein